MFGCLFPVFSSIVVLLYDSRRLLGGLLGGLGGLGLGLDDLLDDLLLLDQESADDSVTDTVGAAGTTVGTVDGLLAARDASVLGGAESGDLREVEKIVKRGSINHSDRVD